MTEPLDGPPALEPVNSSDDSDSPPALEPVPTGPGQGDDNDSPPALEPGLLLKVHF
jgi:hypothetical protein